MNWLVADWSGNKEHVYKGVIEGLTALGHRHTVVSRSNMEERPQLLKAIKSGEFGALLTWQRFYSMQSDVIDAIRESGIRTVFMDFGFVPHYASVVFDADGENATSSWPKFWVDGGPDDLVYEDFEKADAFLDSHRLRVRKLDRPTIPELEKLRFPFVFVPLQRPRDAVIRFDSSVNDFGDMFRRVLLLASGNQYVVCKTHPLDKDLNLGVPDAVHCSHSIIRTHSGGLNEAICDYLLSRASLVVGVNSNMLFRAVVYGSPVLALGSGWYTGSTAIHEVSGVEGMKSLTVPPPNEESRRKYVATCLSRQLEFNELSNPVQLQRVFARIGLI